MKQFVRRLYRAYFYHMPVTGLLFSDYRANISLVEEDIYIDLFKKTWGKNSIQKSINQYAKYKNEFFYKDNIQICNK